MYSFLQFLKTIRQLKDIKRQGILYYGVKEKDVDSAVDHSFRLAVMIWLLGQGKKMNLAKAMKLALVHDLCKVYTGDITPYRGCFRRKIKDFVSHGDGGVSLSRRKRNGTKKSFKKSRPQ